MRAALARGHLVDLVDDDRVDRREQLALRRREQQIERLRRRDEDVRRRAEHLRALRRGRVAGAYRDLEAAERRTEPRGGLGDAGERRAEVALDVDGERLQRRDVEDAECACDRLRLGRLREAVDRREERRERLARAGRREQERRVALRDVRPREDLRARRLAERRTEPLADRRMEAPRTRSAAFFGVRACALTATEIRELSRAGCKTQARPPRSRGGMKKPDIAWSAGACHTSAHTR